MKNYQIIFVVLLTSSVLFYLLYVLLWTVRKSEVKRFGSIDPEQIASFRFAKIKKKLFMSTYLERIIHGASLKISCFNSKSVEQNENTAIVVFGCLCVFQVIVTVAAIILTFPLWYLGCLYSLVILGAAVLVFVILAEMISDSFMKHMPETLRILNSRYASRGNILKAISVSMNDFHPAVRKEMMRIYDALKQNDMEKIRSIVKTAKIPTF